MDEHGEIITVNKAWEDFAIENNAEVNVCEGANYLQVCDEAKGEFAEEAKAFASGIRSVMNGDKDSFSLEYSCDSPVEQRWFTGKVTKFSHGVPCKNSYFLMKILQTERKPKMKYGKVTENLKIPIKNLKPLNLQYSRGRKWLR